MSKKSSAQQKEKSRKQEILLLAELTHRLTGEQESDIRGYLDKFGIQAFFAKLDSTNTHPCVRNKICELYETFGKSE